MMDPQNSIGMREVDTDILKKAMTERENEHESLSNSSNKSNENNWAHRKGKVQSEPSSTFWHHPFLILLTPRPSPSLVSLPPVFMLLFEY
jgi:hypothetical protein